MRTMTAKEYLKLYKDAVRAVDVLQEEYDTQTEQIDSIRSALGGDGLPRSGEVSKRVENQAVKLAEKAEQLLEAKEEALAVRQHIFRTVREVPGEQGDVLRERYINLRHWSEIAEILGYTERQCYNLHNKGLEVVDGLIGSLH